MSTQKPGRQKQTYRRPRLIVYGDVRVLTQAKGGRNGDGQGKPNTRATGKQQ